MSNASAQIKKPSAAQKLAALESRIVDASKPAAAKPAAAKPAAVKAASKGKAAPVKVARKLGISHAVGQSCRPVAGSKLAAYTAAWMASTGFAKGASIARADLVKIAGERAIAYHTGAGNFASGKDGFKLTTKGNAVFSARNVDEQLVAAYTSVLKTGKPSDVAGVKAAHIVALSAKAA